MNVTSRTPRKAKAIAIGMIAAAAFTAACGAAVAANASAADQTALNGTYRVVISDADLEARGITNPGLIHENHGLFTWVLRGGRWQAHQRAENLLNPDLAGVYTIKRDQVTFRFPGGPPALKMRWRLAGRSLRFTLVSGGNAIVRTLFAAHVWKKIA